MCTVGLDRQQKSVTNKMSLWSLHWLSASVATIWCPGKGYIVDVTGWKRVTGLIGIYFRDKKWPSPVPTRSSGFAAADLGASLRWDSAKPDEFNCAGHRTRQTEERMMLAVTLTMTLTMTWLRTTRRNWVKQKVWRQYATEVESILGLGSLITRPRMFVLRLDYS